MNQLEAYKSIKWLVNGDKTQYTAQIYTNLFLRHMPSNITPFWFLLCSAIKEMNNITTGNFVILWSQN